MTTLTQDRLPAVRPAVPPKRDRSRRRRGGLEGLVTVVILLPLVVFFAGAWLAGWRLQHVQTGSMEPTYPTDSLIVSTPIDASQVDIGMAITFVDPGDRGRLVTHRVIRIERDEAGQVSFVTKGDANPDEDSEEVAPGDIQSRVRWAVPHLGRVMAEAQGPKGIAVLLGIPLVMLLVGEVRDRRRARSPVTATGPAADGAGGDGVLDQGCDACGRRIACHDRYCRHCGARHECGSGLVG